MNMSIKKVWKILPGKMREFPLKCFCNLRVGKRNREVLVPEDAPVYIIGNFQSGGGISRSAELYAIQIKNKNKNCICVDTTQEMLQSIKNPITDGSVRRLVDIKNDQGSGTVIIHLNPPQFQWLLCKVGRTFLQHKRIIAYWAWELEDIPSLWKHALNFVDEIEVPSSFTQIAIARNTHKKVTVRPHLVPLPAVVKHSLGKDGKLHCLYVFDMASLCSRKNPQAVIEAFVRAFTPEQANLTIKIGQAQVNPADLKKLQDQIRPHPHIRLMTDWLDEKNLERLYLENDVYLSLHRSEGYGLTIREAMLHNLCVVATGWSGNMDFMQGERVFPVPYRLVPVDKMHNNFWAIPHARWAEADTQKAAEILKKIYCNILKKHCL